jgi:hypothetical protein
MHFGLRQLHSLVLLFGLSLDTLNIITRVLLHLIFKLLKVMTLYYLLKLILEPLMNCVDFPLNVLHHDFDVECIWTISL